MRKDEFVFFEAKYLEDYTLQNLVFKYNKVIFEQNLISINQLQPTDCLTNQERASK
jgi:hypothetical protein